MRIATWNVNSLRARLEKVTWWLERARPDVLLMQETKLADADAPRRRVPHRGLRARAPRRGPLERRGHRQPRRHRGRRHQLRRAAARRRRTPDVGDDEPLAEARMIAAVCGGVRVVSLYAPNGRTVDSPFYQAKLAWYERLARWLERGRDADGRARRSAATSTSRPTTPTSGIPRPATAAPTSPRPSARPSRGSARWGLVDAYRLHHREPGRFTWWDYRAGNFHKNFGMRIDHLLVTPALAAARRRGPRSTARRARASRCRRTTRRS